MGEELEAGCTRPAVDVEQATEQSATQPAAQAQGVRPMIQVGKKAPEFSAPAYFNGGFSTVSLSDFLGKWVVLCFYPGDFTFV